MAGMTTANSGHIIRSNVWSEELKEILRDDLQAQAWVKQLPDFMGTTLNIPSIGQTTVKDYVEDTPVTYDAMDTGNYTFTVDQYLASATYITAKDRADAYKAQELESRFVPEQRRALEEHIETRIFATTQNAGRGGQTSGATNAINGADHRWVANGTSEVMTLEDFARAKFSLKKANVPLGNLVAFVDPSVGYQLETLTNLTNVSNNPQWEGIIETGLTSGTRFIKNIYGFDVYESNYLPTANETIGAKTTTAGVSNILFSADSTVTPFLFSWKQQPTVDSEWNKDFQREEYVTTARYGVQIFRPENMVCILSDTDQISF